MVLLHPRLDQEVPLVVALAAQAVPLEAALEVLQVALELEPEWEFPPLVLSYVLVWVVILVLRIQEGSKHVIKR